jgi:hypothetical protein
MVSFLYARLFAQVFEELKTGKIHIRWLYTRAIVQNATCAIHKKPRTARIRLLRSQIAYTRSIKMTDWRVRDISSATAHIETEWAKYALSPTGRTVQNVCVRMVEAVVRCAYVLAMRARVPPPSKRTKCSHAQLSTRKVLRILTSVALACGTTYFCKRPPLVAFGIRESSGENKVSR